MEFNSNKPLRVFEAFAGYGSQSMALQRLHEDYPEFAFEVVGISEISKPAIAAYKAVHGDHIHNYGDITKIDWSAVSDFDLLTYSSLAKIYQRPVGNEALKKVLEQDPPCYGNV